MEAQGQTCVETRGRARTKKQQVVDGIAIPEHMRLSDNEAAYCARLVRLMRHRQYWMKFFVLWLLKDTAASADTAACVSVEDVERMLKDMKNFCVWDEYMDKLKSRIPELDTHPHFYKNDNPAPLAMLPPDASEEEEFEELVRMWRAEHPEPERKFAPR